MLMINLFFKRVDRSIRFTTSFALVTCIDLLSKKCVVGSIIVYFTFGRIYFVDKSRITLN